VKDRNITSIFQVKFRSVPNATAGGKEPGDMAGSQKKAAELLG
jgi:hypothetical protein